MIRILTVYLMLFIANPAYGEDVIRMLKDQPAPVSGLLVMEGRFTKMLEAEIERDRLRLELDAQKRLTSTVETVYNEKLREATKPEPWYKTPEFNRWVGFVLGVAATVAVLYGGSQLVKAID